MREKALEKLQGGARGSFTGGSGGMLCEAPLHPPKQRTAAGPAVGLALLCFLLLLLRHRQHRLRLLHARATLLRLRQLREGRHYARVVVATR